MYYYARKKNMSECLVCGDKALGLNYNCLTCVSCRTFFKRNGDKIDTLKCPKFDACPIDISTRKSCTKCRLAKCLSIGMRLNATISTKGAVSPPAECTTEIQYYVHRNCAETFINIEIETQFAKTLPEVSSSIAQRLDCMQNGDQQQTTTATTIKRKYAQALSAHEREVIVELQNASSTLVDERTLPELFEPTDDYFLVNWPKFYAKSIIKFCKRIRGFCAVPVEDQLKLLREFYLRFVLFRAIFRWDVKKNGFLVLQNEHETCVTFMSLSSKTNILDKYSETFRKKSELAIQFHHQMENDPIICDLLSGLMLFKHREGLILQEFIRRQYFVYAHVLNRYLEHKYKSLTEAAKKFSTLLYFANSRMDWNISQSVAIVRAEVFDLNILEKFLREVYGLVE